ncbi:ty3-gypsy retrotransposon protein [Tanacetum coccineum]|uniref:Ty3-gypsy retrotransposon protein n=1 Tax=Tanacetum coccineum TaxID=301880 RepID=A0ABQ5H1S5_9ASTR
MTDLIVKMLKGGLIKPSHSPYSSSVLLVRKKDGTWRFCVDYHALNAVTIRDLVPIPTVDGILDELHGARIFSKIDLRAGLLMLITLFRRSQSLGWNEDANKATIRALKNVEAIELAWIRNDGVSRDLLEAIGGFRRAVVMANTSQNTSEQKDRVEIDENTMLKDLDLNYRFLSRTFLVWRSPKVKNKFRFVVMGNMECTKVRIHRRLDFKGPLLGQSADKYAITAFVDALDDVYIALAENSGLSAIDTLSAMNTETWALPNFSLVFDITTDALSTGIGAVLSQEEKPIAFFSKKLSSRMRASSTYIRELYAITEVIQSPDQHKWASKLLGYDSEVHYKPGIHSSPIGGHSGINATIRRLNGSFVWPKLRKDVTRFIQECTDIHGFYYQLALSNGKSTIWVIVDRLTKFAHFLALPPHYTTTTLATLYLQHVYRLLGIPKTIVSDRDPIFLSRFWKELFNKIDTQLLYSSAYHPQTDGQTEVVNRCLESYLRCFLCDKPKDWSKPPPTIPHYTLGSSQVASIDSTLNINVYLHFSKTLWPKLAKLPPGWRIHPLFHVSLLKPSHGDLNPTTYPFPDKYVDYFPVMEAEEFLDHRTINKQGKPEAQVIVKWKGRDITEATWEPRAEMTTDMPDLEDKVLFEDGDIDTVEDTQVQDMT